MVVEVEGHAVVQPRRHAIIQSSPRSFLNANAFSSTDRVDLMAESGLQFVESRRPPPSLFMAWIGESGSALDGALMGEDPASETHAEPGVEVGSHQVPEELGDSERVGTWAWE